MNQTSGSDPPRRFVGLDVHRRSVMVAAVDGQQAVLVAPYRCTMTEFPDWARVHLAATDAVVIEASSNVWPIVDLLRPLVATVVVAHPAEVKHITAARVKNDARDALKLAKLLAANLIPEVWIPPPDVRQLRRLVAYRRRLVSQRARVRNQLQGVLYNQNILPPTGNLFTQAKRAWWETLTLPAPERLRVRQELQLHDHLSRMIKETEQELARVSTQAPWGEQMPFLLQLPGIGCLAAVTILSALGDITRFPTAKQLVGYSGLGASVHASGETSRTGRMTKTGRRELRTAMIESAWMAVAYDAQWKARFERLARRIGRPKAIGAIARKLLVLVWHVLTERVADRNADEEAVIRTLFRWTTRYRLARLQGVSRSTFVRKQLDRLGIGKEVRVIRFGAHLVSIASSDQGDLRPYTRLR